MSKTASGLSRKQLQGKAEIVAGVEKWEADGRRIWLTVNRSAWELGDWWNQGEPYGDRLERALAIGFDHGGCRNAGRVASAFDVSRRRDTLGWSFHAEVTALPMAEDQDAWLDKAEENGWSRKQLRAELRALPRLPTPLLPDGVYPTIVADPPWPYDEDWPTFPDEEDERSTTRALPYQYMTLDEIRELEVAELIAADSHLFLWTTNRFVRDAFDIAEAWGFEVSHLLVWCKKPHGLGLGGTFSNTTEFVLHGRAGTPETKQRVDSTWWEWPRGKHSEKPAAFLDLVESICPGPYLEMFARSRRRGWTAWGIEA